MATKAFQVAFDGDPAGDDLYGDIREVEVEETVEGPSTFRLTIGIVQDASGAWSHIDDDVLSLFTRITVSLGFLAAPGGAGNGAAVGGFPGASPAGLEPLIDGYITQVDLCLGATATDAWLEVQGMDAGVLLGLEEKARAWPNMADSDIVQQVVSGYALQVDAQDTTPVRQDTETLVLQRGSDAQLARQLAARNGYLFYFARQRGEQRATCHFGPPKLDGTPQASLAAQVGEDSNLVSLQVSMTGVRPLAVTARQVDARSKEDAEGTAQGSQLRSLGQEGLSDLVAGKLGQLVTPQDSQAGMLLLAQPSADPTELAAVTQAVRDTSEWLIMAHGEINSDAYGAVLRAGRLVPIRGAGKEYSGNYFVTRVRHLMQSTGVYRQLFTARRNARSVDGSEQFGGGAAGLGVPSV
jgi:uncharacterized protein